LKDSNLVFNLELKIEADAKTGSDVVQMAAPTSTETKQYVLSVARSFERTAVIFQFTQDTKVMWWQRKSDFEHEENWEMAAANSYAVCAAALLRGKIEPRDIPSISMGNLQIAIAPAGGTAHIVVRYYEYDGPTGSTQAQYTFVMPVAHLAAAFNEAATRIRTPPIAIL